MSTTSHLFQEMTCVSGSHRRVPHVYLTATSRWEVYILPPHTTSANGTRLFLIFRNVYELSTHEANSVRVYIKRLNVLSVPKIFSTNAAISICVLSISSLYITPVLLCLRNPLGHFIDEYRDALLLITINRNISMIEATWIVPHF